MTLMKISNTKIAALLPLGVALAACTMNADPVAVVQDRCGPNFAANAPRTDIHGIANARRVNSETVWNNVDSKLVNLSSEFKKKTLNDVDCGSLVDGTMSRLNQPERCKTDRTYMVRRVDGGTCLVSLPSGGKVVIISTSIESKQ